MAEFWTCHKVAQMRKSPVPKHPSPSMHFMHSSIRICVLCICRLLCLGRFLVGLGIGISAVVVPVYLGEVAPAQVDWRACYALAASTTHQQTWHLQLTWCLSTKSQLLLHMHAKPLTTQHLLSEVLVFFCRAAA